MTDNTCKKYYPLHVHTCTGSVGDSILQIKDYIRRAKKYNLDAIAITDHGSMSAMYSFYDECVNADIKPIIGMEAYVVNDNTPKDSDHRYNYGHLVLLAKNQTGLNNLLKIHNLASIEGFYYKPRIEHKYLKKYGAGIIGLSACVGGEIPIAIKEGNLDRAEELILFYKDCFDDFYLEIQPGTFDLQIKVNNILVFLSKKTNTDLVVTNDIHYLREDDYKAHDYHVRLKRKNFDNNDNTLIYPDKCYWFMNYERLCQSFVLTDNVTEEVISAAIKNASLIAHSCNVTLKNNVMMPVFDPNIDESVRLEELCYSAMGKLAVKSKCNIAEYMNRLRRELKVIQDKGFCGYFLIVQDYVNWARTNGIAVGPGRGSAAGSLVSFLLGITQVDPIRYNLIFERFLDPSRNKIPDIDVDFDPDYRDNVMEYVIKKYGNNNCSQVSTLNIRHAKSSIRDSARALGYPTKIGDSIANAIKTTSYDDDGEKLMNPDIIASLDAFPEFAEKIDDYEDIINLAIDLENIPFATGLHAAGVIISPKDLTGIVPLIKSNKREMLATSLALDDAERLLVKFDYLGLSSLQTISATEKIIGKKFDYTDSSLYEDKKVWEMIGAGNTVGVFQISSKTYRNRLPRIKPKNMNDLANCLALIRGSCIQEGTDETYMRILEGKENVKKVHPIFDEITKDTLGIIVYQEQVMNLAVGYGMTLSQGYDIVKKGAKKDKGALQKYRNEFVSCAIKKGVSNKLANQMFDLIEASSAYSFNRSHAVSYGMITYAEAYLKANYPLEYMSSFMTYLYTKNNTAPAEFNEAIKECIRLGIKFLKPDINKSSREFTVENGMMRIGLCAVKGIGEKALNSVFESRPFSSMEDIFERIDKRTFSKTAFSVAIFSGMLDEIESGTRKSMYEKYMTLRKEKKMPEEIKVNGKFMSLDAPRKNIEKNILSGNYKIEKDKKKEEAA